MSIRIQQTHRVACNGDDILRSINDPELLKFCIPKCRWVRGLGDGKYKVCVDVGVLDFTCRVNGEMNIKPLRSEEGLEIRATVRTSFQELGTVESVIMFSDELDMTVLESETVVSPRRTFSPIVMAAATPLAKSLSNMFIKRFNLAVAERV